MWGRLTRDAELKQIPSGKYLSTFSIASNRYAGKDKDEVSFFDINYWDESAKNLNEYLTKGKMVIISGYLEQQRWEQDGSNRSKVIITAKVIQIVYIEQKTPPNEPNNSLRESSNKTYTTIPPTQQTAPVQNSFPGPEAFDDDIPF